MSNAQPAVTFDEIRALIGKEPDLGEEFNVE